MANKKFSARTIGDIEEIEVESIEQDMSDIIEDEPLPVEEATEINKVTNPLKKTLKRIIAGAVIIVLAVVLFFLGGVFGSGEGISTIAPSPVNPGNNNKLVYVTGAALEQEFTDPMFNVSARGLGLERLVEMYQWSLEKDTYIKKWSSEPIAISDEDAKNKGFINPAELPFFSDKWLADKVMIGDFNISPELVKQLSNSTPLAVTEENFNKLNEDGKNAFKLFEGGYFFGIDPANPHIGDLRITFKASAAGQLTVLAKQSANSLEPYIGKNGLVGILRAGNHDLAAMKQGIVASGNLMLTIAMRAVSVLCLIIGGLIIIGKNPFRKKEKIQEGNSISPMIVREETESYVDAEEDVQVADDEEYDIPTDIIEPNDIMVTETPTIKETRPSTYVDPVLMRLSTTDEDGKKRNVNIPVIEKTEAPAPLEFEMEDSNHDIYAGEESKQHQSLGEYENKPGSTGNNAYVSMDKGNQPGTTYEPRAESNRYVSSGYSKEYEDEMPDGVDVISDGGFEEMAGDINSDVAEQSNSFDSYQNPFSAPSHTLMEEVSYLDNSTQIPDEVEVISEEEDAPESLWEAKEPLHSLSSDELPDNISDNSEEPVFAEHDALQNILSPLSTAHDLPDAQITPEPELPSWEEAELEEEDNGQASLPALPPLPDFLSFKNAPEPELPSWEEPELEEEDNVQASLPALPPLPDFLSFKNAPEPELPSWEEPELEEEDNGQASLPALPPLPDFLSFKNPPEPELPSWAEPELDEENEEPASLPALPPLPDFDKFTSPVAKQSEAMDNIDSNPLFDLPNIPEDFDPNQEMPALSTMDIEDFSDTPMEEDAYSPFDTEDTFATTEEEK